MLLQELREKHIKNYRGFLRMDPEIFDTLHNLIRDTIRRQDIVRLRTFVYLRTQNLQ